MLKNYLKLAWKVLLRRKFFTFISLFGIAFTLVVLTLVTALLDHVVAAYPPRPNTPAPSASTSPSFAASTRVATDWPAMRCSTSTRAICPTSSRWAWRRWPVASSRTSTDSG